MKQKVYLSKELQENPAFWEKQSSSFYYSGHCNRGSAFEKDNTCGNCDGANCAWCKKVITEPHYEFVSYTDTIYKDLIKQGIDREIASDLAYSDYPCKTHYLVKPTEIPDHVKNKIETPDVEVWKWCEENYDNEDCFDLRDKYRCYMQAKGISWDEGLDYYLNQAKYWYITKKRKSS